MATMTKRERCERTMNFQETDRIPIYDLLRCDAAFEYFSGEKLPPLSKSPDIEEKLAKIVGKAVNKLLDMTRSVGFGPIVEEDIEDYYGFIRHSSPSEKTTWIKKKPFLDEKGAIEFLKRWVSDIKKDRKAIEHNPSEYREKYHDGFLKTQALIGDTVNLFAQQGVGLDDIRVQMGFELFSYVYADDPGIISECLEECTKRNITICHAIADVKLSPCVLTYGDIACKQRLLHSPEFLRKEFFPRLKRINDAWHEHGFKCLFHSDGYLMDVMDDLIATGIDGLNPIETVAGMSIKEIREKYGNKIFLAGGIDMSQLLAFGNTEGVKEYCRKTIKEAYPGYFIGSTTEIDNSTKLENIIAIYEVVHNEKF
ncbi:MAG TPA: uroporphyrinogen decarboxylase family protein [bacterium]|nr:uroporphyrinogen decarboxylase family protein [bacterium]HOL49870.1 uroporphyrinogen decarboxylase family protein [bacterium]